MELFNIAVALVGFAVITLITYLMLLPYIEEHYEGRYRPDGYGMSSIIFIFMIGVILFAYSYNKLCGNLLLAEFIVSMVAVLGYERYKFISRR